jgi:hypothetical protein
MAKKTEVLTNNNEKLNELLMSIQQETAYKVIRDTLGGEVYEAINNKNFIDLIIAYEKLEYSKTNRTNSQKVALEMISNFINEYDLKNFKDDLKKFSQKLFCQEAMTKEKFTNYYNRTANKIRNYVILKFIDNKKIEREELKEVWKEINCWYKNIMFDYKEYVEEQDNISKGELGAYHKDTEGWND